MKKLDKNIEQNNDRPSTPDRKNVGSISNTLDQKHPNIDISRKQKKEQIIKEFIENPASILNNKEKIQYLNKNKDVILTLIEAGEGRSVAEHLGYFQGWDKEVALKLIEAGEGQSVAEYLNHFQGLNHKEVALKLIEAGEGQSVAKYLGYFQGLDKEVALKLIKAGEGRYVAKDLDYFWGLDKEAALKLIEVGQGGYVAENLDYFDGLDKEVALKLIKAGEVRNVAENLDYFQGLDKEVALKLIEAGEGRYVAENLDYFQGLDKEVALRLIKAGEGRSVATYLNHFQELDHKEIASKLIEEGGGRYVAAYLNHFQGLDHKEIASKLIESGEGWSVAAYLNHFQGLDHKEIASKLIESGEGWSVAAYLNHFQGLDHKEVASKLIEAGEGRSVAKYLNHFQGLDKEVALKLIEEGEGRYVAEYLNHFQGLNYKEIALELIKAGKGRSVAEYLDHFLGLDKEVALKLIKAGEGRSVAEYLNYFGLNYREVKEIALKLIKAGEGRYVAVYLNYFYRLDHKEVALRLIKAGEGRSVAEYLGHFYGLNHKEMASKLIEAGEERSVAKYLNHFQGLDKEIALKLIEAGGGQSVAKYLDHFQGLDREIALRLVKTNGAAQNVITHLKSFGKFNDSDYREIAKSLDESLKEKGLSRLSTAFQQGIKYFREKPMILFLARRDTICSNVLDEFIDVLDCYELSHSSAKSFYYNILQQVKNDTQTYEGGNSYSYLSIIMRSVANDLKNNRIEDVLKQIQNYPQISELKKLGESLSQEKILSSWKNLKKYYEIKQLLGKKEVLDKIEYISEHGNPKLANYLQILAFHPDSDVDIKSALDFALQPKSFLDRDDPHTSSEIQNNKKPSNYTDIPNLDLTPKELRDALVEGVIDKIGSFRNMRIAYTLISGEKKEPKSMPDLVKEALGSRREGVKGKARSPSVLYKKLTQFFKKNQISISSYLKEEVEIPENLIPELKKILYEKNIGLTQKERKEIHFVAEIGKKEDPQTVLAGDDTVNCMSFGAGKNNIYMFNPNTAYFLIKLQKSDGKWRTIAQSVLTIDADIKSSVSKVIDQLSKEDTDLSSVIPPNILSETSKRFITCDNIEVAPNYQTPKYKTIIENLYRDFFQAYLSQYGKKQRLNSKRVIIGIGFSDAFSNLPKIDNTFIPLAPIGYSDNLRSQSYALDLNQPPKLTIENKKVTFPNDKEKTSVINNLPEGVSQLTFTDTLQVAYIEGKAYADNPNFMAYLSNLENGLIAKDINNTSKNRPNLSFKYADPKGKVRGYILAYEGIRGFHDDRNRSAQEKVIYISDLASDKTNPLTGGKLINAFLQFYKKYYLDKKIMIPIYAEVRESTSYQLILRNLKRLSRELNVDFRLEEMDTYKVGDEVVHPVVIRPIELLSKKE